MARRPKKDEIHYFRVTFEDGSSEKWGFHPLDLRGNHMARQFAREREEIQAKLEKREARKITGVNRISGYLKKSPTRRRGQEANGNRSTRGTTREW